MSEDTTCYLVIRRPEYRHPDKLVLTIMAFPTPDKAREYYNEPAHKYWHGADYRLFSNELPLQLDEPKNPPA